MSPDKSSISSSIYLISTQKWSKDLEFEVIRMWGL